MEYRFYPEGTTPPVSTFEFHEHRERAPHLEQPVHRPRLMAAAGCVLVACRAIRARDQRDPGVSDLGCGDGGLLSLLPKWVRGWGYDFAPANAAGWAERGVRAEQLDVFGGDHAGVELGDVAVCTEVLEHLADPHAAVRWIAESAEFLVASSPWTETAEQHDECHAWAWDLDGYRALVEQGGFRVLRQETVSWFQVVLAWRP